MKIFLDFDNTLAHTRKFYEEVYAPLLASTKKSKEEIESAYQTFSKGTEPGRIPFTPIRHLQKLGVAKDLQASIWQEVQKALFKERAFLFPDTIKLLQELQKKSFDLYLLTFGDTVYQNLKIDASGIRDFFTECLVTDGNKRDILKGVIRSDEAVIFIDDHEDYFPDLKVQFGQRIHTVHFLHQEIKEKCLGCSGGHHAKNAKEVISIIENICAE